MCFNMCEIIMLECKLTVYTILFDGETPRSVYVCFLLNREEVKMDFLGYVCIVDYTYTNEDNRERI